ncbi:exported protein of unknown function [Candidatus Filomicrobium marinum]|uniref:Uncharacterized protein n=1 Tax=Candidatus Filomicrobium marinum TaxID=1608628 RepID=A0A0D6JGT4_9HYPH|nr:exported protein of unknown function [Candidatus Filomicrobium marinum]CPR20526.1 exported protein of unknown function [Candidatus Filomicrobium marinum]
MFDPRCRHRHKSAGIRRFPSSAVGRARRTPYRKTRTSAARLNSRKASPQIEQTRSQHNKRLVAAILIALAGPAYAENTAHAAKELVPADMKFEDNPAFPKGAQTVVVYGDPSKPGMFILRLKMPRITSCHRTFIPFSNL